MKTSVHIVALISIVYAVLLKANDGAYHGAGSSLRPVRETQISVRKELLVMKRVGKFLHVTVNYVMFNPGPERTLTVGFEGSSPSGDVEIAPKNDEHPYISDFQAIVNGTDVQHEVHFFTTADINSKDHKRKMISREEARQANAEEGPEVDYVYTFTARFVPGENTIRHSYIHRLSSSVTNNYAYEYILTAANRWANNQIDDFTLILDVGPFENIFLPMTFFTGTSGWKINGKGTVRQRSCVDDVHEPSGTKQLWFYIESGFVEFTAKNFHPRGELSFSSPGILGTRFDCRQVEQACGGVFESLQYSISAQPEISWRDYTASQIKILEGLPFARRGMVFKDAAVQNFYENCTDWYVRNPSYVPRQSDLLPEERSWLMSLRH